LLFKSPALFITLASTYFLKAGYLWTGKSAKNGLGKISMHCKVEAPLTQNPVIPALHMI